MSRISISGTESDPILIFVPNVRTQPFSRGSTAIYRHLHRVIHVTQHRAIECADDPPPGDRFLWLPRRSLERIAPFLWDFERKGGSAFDSSRVPYQAISLIIVDTNETSGDGPRREEGGGREELLHVRPKSFEIFKNTACLSRLYITTMGKSCDSTASAEKMRSSSRWPRI